MSRARSLDLRHRQGLLALLAVALAYGLVMQSLGWAQTSYYALVKSLSDGTARIDQYHWETRDKAWYEGHFYSVKAPGLPYLTLPLYEALDAVGAPRLAADVSATARRHGASRWAYRGLLVHQYGNDPVRAARVRHLLEGQAPMVWALSLLGVVAPALALLLLVRWAGERVARGYGTAAAVAFGLGTLMLPFSTMLFSHVLSALLGFGAFALLWHERDGPQRLGLVALAGLLAGLAVTTEYPLALAGAVVGLYAIARPGAIRRGLVYAGGALAGVAPLLAYNRWAFGSFTHTSYADAVDQQGLTGHATLGLNDAGFFGISTPKLRFGLELLLAPRGLLVLCPVLVAAGVGVVLAHRRGLRAEARVIGAVALVYLVYNAGYWLPFGGGSPGPRFLIPVLPFLAVGLAPAFRRFPALTVALAVPSVIWMLAATVTKPLIGSDHTGVWAQLAGHASFEHTVLSAVGAGNGWLALSPVLLAIATSIALAARASPRLGLARDARWAALAVVVWVCVICLAPLPLDHLSPLDRNGSSLWLIGLGAAGALLTLGIAVLRERRRPAAATPLIGLAASPALSDERARTARQRPGARA